MIMIHKTLSKSGILPEKNPKQKHFQLLQLLIFKAALVSMNPSSSQGRGFSQRSFKGQMLKCIHVCEVSGQSGAFSSLRNEAN